MSHRFVWVDIPVHDLDRAIAFYAAVLDRAVTREGGPGFSFGVLAHSGSDVAGCLYLADDDNAPSPRGPLVYLNVDGRHRRRRARRRRATAAASCKADAPDRPARLPRDRPRQRRQSGRAAFDDALTPAPRGRRYPARPAPDRRIAMCRNIKTLFNFEPPATELEIRDAVAPVRSQAERLHRAFEGQRGGVRAAVEQVADAARGLIGSLVTNAEPRDREIEAERARARSRGALRRARAEPPSKAADTLAHVGK